MRPPWKTIQEAVSWPISLSHRLKLLSQGVKTLFSVHKRANDLLLDRRRHTGDRPGVLGSIPFEFSAQKSTERVVRS
jgi:hypothetical protein